MAWTPDRIVALSALCAVMLAAEIFLGYRSRRTPFSLFDQLSGLLASAGSIYVVTSTRGSLPWAAFALCLVFGLATYVVADFVLRRSQGSNRLVRTLAVPVSWAIIGFASLVPAYVLHSSA
jgi:EamA domain-containing membrane protein RarD